MADPVMSHVVVVDDTEGNRYVTARILRSAGYDVSEAADGKSALAIIDAREVDLFVLDINLPDITGYELLDRIRTLPRFAATPVLHLSASYTSNQDRAHGLERGADAYLTHPLDPSVFVATVKSLLRASAADKLLHRAAREWQATFDALNDAVLLLDQQAVVRRANLAACALLHEQDVIGHPLAELLARKEQGDAHRLVDQLLEGQMLDKALFQLGDRSYHVTTHYVQDAPAAFGTVCIMQDVTERLASERERTELLAEAQRAREEAEAANRAKNEFLAVMSHELRTPLNAIGGYAQLIELGVRGPISDALRSDVERIRRSQMYLTSLINDVLNFAKIESGHVTVDMVDLSIGMLVNSVRDFVEPQLTKLELEFTVKPCLDDVKVRADEEKVQQILINLLSNALKFTHSGGSITLECVARTHHVDIVVSDTGRGIAPDKLDTIFEPFVQVDRRYKREQEGIGLGLTISRDLARVMGGDLTVSSTPGEGSVFTLTLRRST
jgi:PAS domain S-box-containing protein